MSSLESNTLEVSKEILKRMFVTDITKNSPSITFGVQTGALFNDYSLGEGAGGLALLCAALDVLYPDEAWDIVGRIVLQKAANTLSEQKHIGIGMFDGLAGFGFSVLKLSNKGKRYSNSLQSINTELIRAIDSKLRLMKTADFISIHSYDLISGLTGVGAYLLSVVEETSNSSALDALKYILSFIIKKSENVTDRFKTSYEFIDKDIRTKYPYGYVNMGLAHGLPGPLALLSLSSLANIEVPNLSVAIVTLSDFIKNEALPDSYGVNWRYAVPFNSNGGIIKDLSIDYPLSRSAWCYGAPGISRALFLAGKALKDIELQSYSINTIMNNYKKVSTSALYDPMFCHGLAGLLTITDLFYKDTKQDGFLTQREYLISKLLSLKNENHALLYQNTEKYAKSYYNPSSLLTGTSGIVLSMLDTYSRINLNWQRAFLLN